MRLSTEQMLDELNVRLNEIVSQPEVERDFVMANAVAKAFAAVEAIPFTDAEKAARGIKR